METIGDDLRHMQRIPLAASHVEALRAAGTLVTYPAGTFIVRPGDPADRFIYVEDGEIELVNPFTDERLVPTTLGPTQFMGEISFLSGGAWSMPMRTARDTRVIEVPRQKMLTLMSRIPEMSDIIITVLSARRRRQLENRDSSLRLIGEEQDRNVRRIAAFASRNRIPYTSLPLGSPEALATARSCAIGSAEPAVIFGRAAVMTDPTPDKVARLRLADFEGAGIYYAATEIEARYCKETEAIIIGGGNSAGQAAMFLSRSARCVRVLVRGSSLAASMSNYLSSRLDADPRISIEYNAEVTAVHGDTHLDAVSIRDATTGTTRVVGTHALFIMVGAAPNTEWLSGQVDLDNKGFVVTGSGGGADASPYSTSLQGVFAVGDVRAGSVKRVASAVGEGSVVISKVWEFVNRKS
jgi:CRP-like cAMP-binding protein